MERVTLRLLPRAGFPARRPRVRWSHSDTCRCPGGELVHPLNPVLRQEFREDYSDVCYVHAIRNSYGPMYRFHRMFHMSKKYFSADPSFVQADERIDPSTLKWEQAKWRNRVSR